MPYPPDNGAKIRIFNVIDQLSRRHEVSSLRPWVGIAPGLGAPGMNFLNLADGPRLDQDFGETVMAGGMDLNSHLGHELALGGELG